MVNKVPFSKIFIDNTKNAIKIPKENYLDDGKIPVVDQGQKYIGGYVNYVKAYTNLPCIIFGDHTRIIKYVDFPFTIGADGVKLLNINNDNFSPKFLYYHLLNFKIPNIGYNRHFKFLKELYFTSYDLQTQQKIVEELDCLSDIIEKKKQQLADLDNLIKSQFIEMFGDVDTNSKKWQWVAIKDIGNCIAGATPSTKEPLYWENGTIPWMSSGEVHKYRIFDTDTKITELGYKNASTKLVPPNTVVLAMAGQGKTRGTAGITQIELCTNQSICSIVNNDKVNPWFLLYYLKQQYEELRNASNGAGGRGGLNLKIIGSFKIYLPPIELQIEFEKHVKQIDNLKLNLEQSIEETQNLFNERMQHYFGE